MAKTTQSSPRLGRGLSSLISNSVRTARQQGAYETDADDPAVASEKTPRQLGNTADIPLDNIAPNPYQPRRAFNDAELAELAESIAQQGIIQPLIVAHATTADAEQPYVLIAGERRLRAARLAALDAVPCVIRQADERQMLEWALVENIQRTDLNPIERATAYRDYIDRFSLTQLDAGQRLGQPRATVANYLRVLDLQMDVQDLVKAGSLSFGHAKVLAALLDSPRRQTDLARRTVADGLSVRQLERLVAAGKRGAIETDTQQPAPKHMPPAYVLDMEERLTQAIGTKVSIRPGRAKHTGTIQVEYYSLDDFDRISASLGLRPDES